MSVEMTAVYEGGLRCRATHGPSGNQLITDAPVDNHGKGESFSPTDLVGTALGACLMTIMGIVAERHKIDIAGTTARVTKDMVQQPVRRIGTLTVTITVPPEKAAAIGPEDRKRLETAALACPVHQSLHPDVKTPIQFVYG